MAIIGETIFVCKFYCFLNGIDATIHPKVRPKKRQSLKIHLKTSVLTLLIQKMFKPLSEKIIKIHLLLIMCNGGFTIKVTNELVPQQQGEN